MADTLAEIADIVIDCSDPELVATFWANVLGRPIEGRKGPYVWLKRLPGGPGLSFQPVVELKVFKNRVHLDVAGRSISEIKERELKVSVVGRSKATKAGGSSSSLTQKETSSVSSLADLLRLTRRGGRGTSKTLENESYHRPASHSAPVRSKSSPDDCPST